MDAKSEGTDFYTALQKMQENPMQVYEGNPGPEYDASWVQCRFNAMNGVLEMLRGSDWMRAHITNGMLSWTNWRPQALSKGGDLWAIQELQRGMVLRHVSMQNYIYYRHPEPKTDKHVIRMLNLLNGVYEDLILPFPEGWRVYTLPSGSYGWAWLLTLSDKTRVSRKGSYSIYYVKEGDTLRCCDAHTDEPIYDEAFHITQYSNKDWGIHVPTDHDTALDYPQPVPRDLLSSRLTALEHLVLGKLK